MNKTVNSNWKQRHREEQDTKIGKEYDKLVELGIRFACVALHNLYGFGEKRITQIRKEVNKYIEKEINSGTAAHSDARRHNVMHGLNRVNEAYEAIFVKKKSAQNGGTFKGADEKTSYRNHI